MLTALNLIVLSLLCLIHLTCKAVCTNIFSFVIQKTENVHVRDNAKTCLTSSFKLYSLA